MPDLSQHDSRYTKLVDRYSRYIKSPVLRLKFLSTALAKARRDDPTLLLRLGRAVPFLGTLPERALLVVEVSKYLPPARRVPAGLRVVSVLYRMRLAVYAVSVAAVVSGGAGAVYLSAQLISGLSYSIDATTGVSSQTVRPAATAGPEMDTLAAAPENIWLAEQGGGYEFYSNGLRLLTELEVTGPERSYYRFDNEGATGQHDSKPAGIVYHLSESDLLPFADKYNSSLINTSRALLEYSRENRLYNYVIDRFGRVYRIVRDEFAANHAGNSVWSDGANVYINLSASFIGVCFEGRYTPGASVGPEGINEAQVYAARVLTAMLRSRYGIKDQNCVTHGLVSVNPSNRLIGYHTDWLSGFPFVALGLTDKHESEMVAVSRFGFGYDKKYLASAGGRKWPGLERADVMLISSAQTRGRSVAEERQARWGAFRRAYEQQKELDLERVKLARATEGNSGGSR